MIAAALSGGEQLPRPGRSSPTAQGCARCGRATPSGVAAFAIDEDGRPVTDFVFYVQGPRFIHARTAPTATYGLVLGRVLAEAATETFGLTASRIQVASS